MILLDKCPVCGGQNLKFKLNCIDHTASNEVFKIVSCETCDFTFTNPRPDSTKLGEYYKSDNYISHTNKKNGFFNRTYQLARNYAIITKLSLVKNVCKKGSLLDIGCGTGEFLFNCSKKGYKTIGIEPSSLARKQAIKNFGLTVSEKTDLSQFSDSQFNIITMWHVLEHIPNLTKTIIEIKRILKNNGKVIIAVPNHKSWDAKKYKNLWAAWDVPIHLWHFSRNTIKNLFNKNGFKLIKTKPMLLDSFYVSILSEKNKTGKNNYIKGIIMGAISNIIGITSKKGCSSTIYVFENNNIAPKPF